MVRFSEQDRQTIWDMREAGVPVKRIARHLGRQNSSLRKFIADAGGRRPNAREPLVCRCDRSRDEPFGFDDLSGGELERRPIKVSSVAGRSPRTTAGLATERSEARTMSAAPQRCGAQTHRLVVSAADLGMVG